MDSHKLWQFRELPGNSQDAVIALLRCAVTDPDGHQIVFSSSGIKNKSYRYEVVLLGKRPPCVVVNLDWDLGYRLIHIGFVTHGDEPWRTFRFLPDIIAWYREMHPPSDEDVRAAVGKYFFELGPGEDALIPFQIETVAEKVGHSSERIHAAVQALLGAGLLSNDGPRGAKIPPYYRLTKLGFQWALRGFRADLGLGASVEVNVSLQLEIQQVINVIAQLPISEEKKQEYENITLKLERELQQGKPSWRVIQDALSMAADTAQLAVPIISVLANYKDQITQAIAHFPVL